MGPDASRTVLRGIDGSYTGHVAAGCGGRTRFGKGHRRRTGIGSHRYLPGRAGQRGCGSGHGTGHPGVDHASPQRRLRGRFRGGGDASFMP